MENVKHWLIICRMNHRPLGFGSNEPVKTHMVVVEISLVALTSSHKWLEISRNLVGHLKKCRFISEPVLEIHNIQRNGEKSNVFEVSTVSSQ